VLKFDTPVHQISGGRKIVKIRFRSNPTSP